MSFGGGSSVSVNAVAPDKISGLGAQTSTSLNGTPRAVVMGTNRVPGNLILFTDAHQTQITTSGKGGKGGLGGGSAVKGVTGEYDYFATVSYGMAIGPIQTVAKIWATTSSPETPLNTSAAPFIQPGSDGQAPWSFLLSHHPDYALGYNGLAVFNVANMALGPSANLPNFTFELMGRGIAARTAPYVSPNATKWTTSYAAPASQATGVYAAVTAVVKPPNVASNIVFDCSPAWCAAELLTDTTWGAGLPPSMIGDLTAYAIWCQAAGIFISPALTAQRAAREILKDWLDASIADVFWSAGKIKFMPYADSPVTGTAADGSPITYAPTMTPMMVIDDSVLLPGQGDEGPITTTITDQTDLHNQVVVEYSDRASDYNTLPALAQNDAHIALYGLRPAPSLQGGFITTVDVAQLVVDLSLARQLGVQATYGWRMRSPGELLEPFDVVALNDPDQGLINYPVRVLQVEEEDDSVFHVTAEDIPGLIGAMATRAAPINAGFVSIANADPGNVNAPVMFEPRGGLLTAGTDLQIWIGVSGADPDWGGADLWVSTDDKTYAFLERITGKNRTGVVSSAIDTVTPAANSATIDTVNQLGVDMSQSGAQLLSTDQAGMLALNTLCYVDGEFISYQNATLYAAGKYMLTPLERGAYGSPIGQHLPGAPFCRVDGSLARYSFPVDRIGQTIYFKFLSFNTLAGGEQTADDVDPFIFTPRGLALADPLADVTGLASAYVAGLTKLIWNPVIDVRGRALDYEIRLGTNPASAMIVGRTPLTESPILGDGTYWVAAHFKVPQGADLYSPDWQSITIANGALVSNVIATYDAASDGWSGAKSGTVLLGGNLSLTPDGDILASADVTAINDLRYFGGVVASGSYTIPVGRRVTLSGPANCNVIIRLGAIAGLDINAVDMRTVADMTALADVIGANLGLKVSIVPQINLSQDGVTWGGWQNWVLASYTAKVFDARVLLSTADINVAALLSDFSFVVDAPDRIDQYAGIVTDAVTGQATVTFQPRGASSPIPFNGGPGPGNTPIPTFSVTDGRTGDDPPTYTISASQIVFTTKNAGTAVSRQINNLIVQGY